AKSRSSRTSRATATSTSGGTTQEPPGPATSTCHRATGSMSTRTGISGERCGDEVTARGQKQPGPPAERRTVRAVVGGSVTVEEPLPRPLPRDGEGELSFSPSPSRGRGRGRGSRNRSVVVHEEVTRAACKGVIHKPRRGLKSRSRKRLRALRA